MAAVNAVESGAAPEARIILLAGEPGTGKSRCVDNFGCDRKAIYVEGMPGMTMAYIRDLLAHELQVGDLKGFQLQKAINEAMIARRQPIILDEAQHGLNNKAAVIEYLRRVVEQAETMLILVCHTSEKHRFSEHKLAHIATRISALVDFMPASLEDTALYLSELCTVPVDDGIVRQAFNESRGRYRLLSSACMSLETLAKNLRKTALVAGDVKGLTLCEDAMRTLRKGVA
ncbi:hypothetical protein A1356_22880 [Methylomonas koyamae]|uniref:ORC1/DEAH AAA+ ATPase domain-containing protein n=2 Tax=Methylomonas koyamae TaxID=702114 RepID=A0AA91DG06_9GAMM|nr:hypothetical protein A1356_22880 [Methylomonas koyamae]